MANRQTKAYRKLGIATSNGGAQVGTMKNFEIFKGKPCITDFRSKDKNPMNKRKSPWKGCRRNPAVMKMLAASEE